jgi:DNA invertase Pin-like site-specific DNA recombinase
MSEPVRAVAYYRMSTDDQEESIPQQQGVMRPKCKLAGVFIEKEFEDHGLSGGRMAGRDAFKEMLAFCRERHRQGAPVQAVVCWDTKRFSRASSIETNHYLWEFMQAGVCLLFTHSDGWIDFRKEEHRVLFNLRQDISNNRDLRDRARDIARGKHANFQANYFNGGPAPYAFDWVLVDENDQPQRRIPRAEAITFKAKGWYVLLVPTEDPEQLEVARWIFQRFAQTAAGYDTIARELNAKGVPGPGSFSKRFPFQTAWGGTAVKHILLNPRYVGDYRYGFRPAGTYYRLVGSEIREAEFNAGRELNLEAPVNRDAHAGIIDRETWDRVQVKIAAKRASGTKARAKGFVLSGGLLRCGLCGNKMQGQRKVHNGKRGRTEYRYYICSGNQTNPGSCQDFSVREDRILPCLVRKLQESYLAPARLEELRAALRRKVAARHEEEPELAGRLRHRLAGLDRDIRQGARNLIRATDNLDLIQEELTALRSQRERLAAELASLEHRQGVPLDQLNETVERAVAKLYGLRESLASAKPEQLKALLAEFVVRVDLYFDDRTGLKKNQWFRFAKGVVKLRPQLDLAGNPAIA